MREDQRGTDRLAELFEHALGLPEEDRQRYATEACRDDPELRAELMSLLAGGRGSTRLPRACRRSSAACRARPDRFDPSRHFAEQVCLTDYWSEIFAERPSKARAIAAGQLTCPSP